MNEICTTVAKHLDSLGINYRMNEQGVIGILFSTESGKIVVDIICDDRHMVLVANSDYIILSDDTTRVLALLNALNGMEYNQLVVFALDDLDKKRIVAKTASVINVKDVTEKLVNDMLMVVLNRMSAIYGVLEERYALYRFE